jgi:hypothetical protein
MNTSIDGRTWGSRWRPAENRMAGLFERIHEQLGNGSWLIGRITGSEYAKAEAYPDRPRRSPHASPGSPDATPQLTASRRDAHGRSPGVARI